MSSVEPATGGVPSAARTAPLIAHVIYGLKTGGVENGLVNLINHLPVERYRHAIVCITNYSDFRLRIRRPDVECYALHKPPGKVPGFYLNVWRLLRRLRPQIVHTRNLTTLVTQVSAMLAGVPVRIHGEHGRDMLDLDGSNVKYQRVRRMMRPFVHEYIALSRDLEAYLVSKIGVARPRLTQIYNGVDTEVFRPAQPRRPDLPVEGFAAADSVIVGDGALRQPCLEILAQAGWGHLAWLPGERADVPRLMQGFDVFVLPSLAE